MVTPQTCADSARQTFQLLLRLQKTISESPALPGLAPPHHLPRGDPVGLGGGNPLTFLNDVLSPACTLVAGFPLGWLFIAFLHQQAMPPLLASPSDAAEVQRNDTTAAGGQSGAVHVSIQSPNT